MCREVNDPTIPNLISRPFLLCFASVLIVVKDPVISIEFNPWSWWEASAPRAFCGFATAGDALQAMTSASNPLLRSSTVRVH